MVCGELDPVILPTGEEIDSRSGIPLLTSPPFSLKSQRVYRSRFYSSLVLEKVFQKDCPSRSRECKVSRFLPC